MHTRRVGPFEVSAIGFGCMSLSHAYGAPPPKEESARVLETALEAGHTFFDTASAYGAGHNEMLVGETLGHRRSEFTLASKCGISRTPDGVRIIDGSPDYIRRTCEESLARLKAETIDLYYLHRLDRKTPIEESVGALAGLVAQGKIRAIGLSEVSADTLRRAHAVHPIAAVQSEYSLWTRNPEVAVLDACRELGVALVAFGNVGRGFLAGGVSDPASLPAGDIRKAMPRFQPGNFEANLRLVAGLKAIGREAGATPAQLCLAWVLAKAPHIVPIPGTTSRAHLKENVAAEAMTLTPETLAALEALINPSTVAGARYTEAMQADIDTEELAA